MIRELIKKNKNISDFVSPFTLNYLYEKGLYDRVKKIKNSIKLLNPEYELWEMKKELFLSKIKTKQLEFYAKNPLLAVDALIIKN
jgi:hypothetical protein